MFSSAVPSFPSKFALLLDVLDAISKVGGDKAQELQEAVKPFTAFGSSEVGLYSPRKVCGNDYYQSQHYFI